MIIKSIGEVETGNPSITAMTSHVVRSELVSRFSLLCRLFASTVPKCTIPYRFQLQTTSTFKGGQENMTSLLS